MDELDLLLNTNCFSSILELCSVDITENVLTKALKLHQNHTQIPQLKFNESVYLINFDYDDVRKNILVYEKWEPISQLLLKFIEIVLNEYCQSFMLADVV